MKSDLSEHLINVLIDLKEKYDFFYWAGFYLLFDTTLHVGPYIGETTDHTQIPVGKGVCGTAVAEKKNQIIDDVSKLGNYLACNLHTKSEYVGLIYSKKSGNIIGQLDIDATKIAAFTPEITQELDQICENISDDFENFRNTFKL